jgi:hypothetical protein
MADLHRLEMLSCLGALVTGLLTVLVPESRARLVAAWALVGVTAAAAVVAGTRVEMYGVYAAALLLALAAWGVSRRVAAAPEMRVWRAGRGLDTEHVTGPASPWIWLGRLLLLLVTLAAIAVAAGLLPAVWVSLLPV